jgi:hypothetical protein
MSDTLDNVSIEIPTPVTPLPVCKYCIDDKVKECLKCKSLFCSIHASHFSPNFCKDCFSNLSVIIDKFQRTSTEYDHVHDTVVQSTSTCKRLTIDGPEWIFYTTWIHELSDEELQIVYEFHYFILKLIESANETKKIARARKMKEVSGSHPIGIVTTKDTHVRREAKQKDMQTELEKLKIPVDTIKAMLLAAGITYRD